MKPASAASPRLIAISVGPPKRVSWRGETVETGIFKTPIEGPVLAQPLGLEGDGQADLSVHGGINKAVYAFDQSSARFFDAFFAEQGRAEPAPTGPGGFGDNLRLEGLPETAVSIGDVFRIGGARFEVSQPRQPCFKLGLRFDDPRFPKHFLASARVGYYLRVVESGELESGDLVQFEHRDPAGLGVFELAQLWTRKPAEKDPADTRDYFAALERATSVPALAAEWREPLLARLARANDPGGVA